MRRSLKIPVKPDVLRWARETVGRTAEDVARHLKISIETVQGWESGEGHPGLSELRELAKYLKRPLAAFFLPSAPVEPALPGAFRRLPEDQRHPLSTNTLLAMRRARRTQELARGLAASELEAETQLPVGAIRLGDDPAVVAEHERQRLGITSHHQSGWAANQDAYLCWKAALERKSLIILELPMPIREARAFSLMDEVAPMIAVNSKDSYAGRTFSLFHEYGHLLLGRSGIADLTEESRLTEEGKKSEQFCNHFAGALLVPEAALLGSGVVKNHPVGAEWEDAELAALAAMFRVSRCVVTRRLLMKGLITADSYCERAVQYEEEIAELDRSRKYGRRVPVKMCVRENGVPFAAMVFKAHAEEKLTYRDVADYLYVKPKYLSAVADVISGRSS